MLQTRNSLCQVFSKLVIKKYANLLNWYNDVEDRLSYEEYEDPN